MKTAIEIQLHAYRVQLRDERTGERFEDTVVLNKKLLQTAGSLGMGANDIIRRLCNRKGYHVFEIVPLGKARRVINLGELYAAADPGIEEGSVWREEQ